MNSSLFLLLFLFLDLLTKKTVLCSVIPYSRSIDDGLVTYGLPENFRAFVQIGSTVYVPWGNDTIIGIVANIDTDIPYEGQLKDITGPHCTVPWLSSSEIALVIHLARQMFTRIHIIVQLFLPEGLIDLFEKHNFLDLTEPFSPTGKGESTYTVAPDNNTIVKHLTEKLITQPGLVIVPEGLSVQWWAEHFEIESLLDTHPKSLASQKKIYLDILSGKNAIVFGTRRTLIKRIGYYRHIYIVHENLSQHIYCGLRKIPLWIFLAQLEKHGHVIHYLSTTPSIRTLTRFLQENKSVQYL